MADQNPDHSEAPDRAPSAPVGAGRRGGLDRLRASRGDATEPTPSEGNAAAGGTGSSAGAATTALLDPVQPAAAPEDEREAQPEKVRRRLRKLSDPAAGTEGAAAAPAGGVPVPRRLVAIAALLAVAVVALLVPVIILRHRIVGQSASERRASTTVEERGAALDAGRRFVIDFFTIDYRKIDAYNAEILSLSTGDFNKDFAGKQSELKQVLAQVQTVSTGSVLTAGVRQVSGSTADVLLVANQDARNKSSNNKTLTTRYRIELQLQKTPKGWLVSNFAPVV